MSDYVATCQDEHIYNFGEGETPEIALEDFLSNGEFHEYCANSDCKNGEMVTIEVFHRFSFDEMDEDEKAFAENDNCHWVTRGKAVLTTKKRYEADHE